LALEYSTYRLELTPRDRGALPAFAGSALRGTFGMVLRDLACATRAPTCDGCRVARDCAYRELFDPLPPDTHALQRFSAIPAPYVFDLGEDRARHLAPGSPLTIGLTLMGRARRHLGLALLAIQRGAGGGLSRADLRLDLRRVTVERRDGGDAVVLDAPGASLRPHPYSARLESLPAAGDEDHRRIAFRLLTPTRLTQDGNPARVDDLKPRTLLMAIARRVSLLADFHGDGPLGLDFTDLAARAAEARFARKALRWQRLERWSSRQQRTMPFDGLVGDIEVEGPLAPFGPLIAFAARLNVGKHASFGLGRYQYRQS
jgi:hypothetical protein